MCRITCPQFLLTHAVSERLEFPNHQRKIARQVFRYDASLGKLGCGKTACPGVKRRCKHACVERRKPLCEKRADHAREHVPRTSLRERRRPLAHRRDNLAVGYEALRPLNKCRHAIRERDKACELTRIIGREAKGGGEPSRLARMGGTSR